jgi:hypothetical protein
MTIRDDFTEQGWAGFAGPTTPARHQGRPGGDLSPSR